MASRWLASLPCHVMARQGMAPHVWDQGAHRVRSCDASVAFSKVHDTSPLPLTPNRHCLPDRASSAEWRRISSSPACFSTITAHLMCMRCSRCAQLRTTPFLLRTFFSSKRTPHLLSSCWCGRSAAGVCMCLIRLAPPLSPQQIAPYLAVRMSRHCCVCVCVCLHLGGRERMLSRASGH